MVAGILAPANGKSDDPHHGKDDRGDPQKMDSEARTEENQNEQQREYEQHEIHNLSD
jgi:hypothetical protein